MPMNFPDMDSLKSAAKVHEFRQPYKGEVEEIYRELLADHVQSKDMIESQEIRCKVGWDKFSDDNKLDLLKRHGFNFD